MWIYYSVQMNDTPLVMRSSTEITLLFASALYIIRNKVSHYQEQQRALQPVELS
jgi:L-rhamnose isomerase